MHVTFRTHPKNASVLLCIHSLVGQYWLPVFRKSLGLGGAVGDGDQLFLKYFGEVSEIFVTVLYNGTGELQIAKFDMTKLYLCVDGSAAQLREAERAC